MKKTTTFILTLFSSLAYAQTTPSTLNFKHLTNQDLASNAEYFKKPHSTPLRSVDNASLTKNVPSNLRSIPNEQAQNGQGIALKSVSAHPGVALKSVSPSVQLHVKGDKSFVPQQPLTNSATNITSSPTTVSKPLGIDGRNIK